MDITLDDMLTILDKHYNDVKALDALNQELFSIVDGRQGICIGLGCPPFKTSPGLWLLPFLTAFPLIEWQS